MKLFVFECKKLFFSKKFLYLLVLLAAGVALLFTRNVVFQPYIQKEAIQAIETQIKKSQSNSNLHQYALERDPKDEEQLRLQKINEGMLSKLYELFTIAPADDWQSKLKLQNEIYADTLAYKEAGGDHPLSEEEIAQTMAMNEKLLATGIPPEHPVYSIAWPNFMKQIVDLLIHFGALLILLMMIGESMSGEYENHSIHMLFTQPLKKRWIVVSKFWSAVLLYIVMMGVVLLLAAVAGFLFGKGGSLHYPVLIEKGGVFEFITIADYMGKGLLLATVTILLVIPLYLLYSLLFKQTLPTLGMLLLTFGAGYLLSTFVPIGFFAWVNPFMNLLPGDMILFQNDYIWYQAIPVTLVLAGVLYLLSSWKINTAKIT